MTDNIRAIKPDLDRMPGGYVETESSTAILRALRRARAMGKPTVIIGSPGVGKTYALHKAKQEAPHTLFLTATAGEGGVGNLARALCDGLNLPAPKRGKLPEARQMIADTIGVDGFLILDEAQYLGQYHRGSDNWEALEWLRSLAENGSFGLAICGDLKLKSALELTPQLRRRTHPQVIINFATLADVTAFCHHRGITDTKEVARLGRIAKRYGGIGDVSEILTTASAMCNGALPEAAHISAAIDYLGFQAGGSR